MPYKDPETKKLYDREYKSIYYEVYGKEVREKVNNRKDMLRDWVNSFKERCFHCTSRDKLEFHHINPVIKFKAVAQMASEGYSKNRILLEIEKCIVLCESCHAKVTYNNTSEEKTVAEIHYHPVVESDTAVMLSH